MTTAYPDQRDGVVAAEGVYAPQDDSRLLIDVLYKSGLAIGRRVADLCTGSGVVAITAAAQGASAVTALDICPRAVRCARVNAVCAAVDVDVHLGSWAPAVEFAPFDLVVCNPPYVPHDPRVNNALPATVGPARAWNAGYDGRLVLDPLCEAVPDLLADRGSLLLVQSEFADPRRTLAGLSSAGLDAEVIAWQWIPFGPVLTSRAWWLEETDRLDPGRREEELLTGRQAMTASGPRVVQVIPNGPVMVQGPVRIELPDGAVLASDRFMVAICACRRSQAYPLCTPAIGGAAERPMRQLSGRRSDVRPIVQHSIPDTGWLHRVQPAVSVESRRRLAAVCLRTSGSTTRCWSTWSGLGPHQRVGPAITLI